MKPLTLTVVALSLLFIQSSVLPAPSGALSARPDLLLLFVLAWSLVFGQGQGVAAAGLAGVLLDTVSAAPLGAHLVALAPAVLLTTLRRVEFTDSPLALSLVLAPMATAAYYLVLALTLQLNGWHVDWTDGVLLVLAPAMVVNLLLSPFFYWGVTALARRLGSIHPTGIESRPLLGRL